MTIDKIETVRTLLKYTGKDNEQAEAVINGAITILYGALADLSRPVTSSPMDGDTVPEKPKKTEKKPTTKRQKFDVGKLGALRKAGWTVAKIADEMGCSEATVYTYMKKEGIT